MHVRRLPVAGTAALLLVAGLSVAPFQASAAASARSPGSQAPHAARVIGTGHAVARSITVRAADRRQARFRAEEAAPPAPLGRNGHGRRRPAESGEHRRGPTSQAAGQ